jgi:hypothetical protein
MLSFLRALLFDNLGIKLVALLLAVALYLHVYTERPATMVLAFPLEIVDLADSLALFGPPHDPVRAELRGTGKQLLRIRLTEPRLKVSLAGVGAGHYERTVVAADLPLLTEEPIEVQRLISPRVISLEIDPAVRRALPVAARVLGVPRSGWQWSGEVEVRPARVIVRGPRREIASMDSVRLQPVRIDGRADSVRIMAVLDSLPSGCSADPGDVSVFVRLEAKGSDRRP